jgi:hypothetical protein
MFEDQEPALIHSAPFRDRQRDQELADSFGETKIRRSIVDGQRGYTTTNPNGVMFFHFRLGEALRAVAINLGHADDREVLVIGEDVLGNQW